MVYVVTSIRVYKTEEIVVTRACIEEEVYLERRGERKKKEKKKEKEKWKKQTVVCGYLYPSKKAPGCGFGGKRKFPIIPSPS